MALSNQDVRALVIKSTRRKLLETLRLLYPATVPFYHVRAIMADVEEHHLKVDVSYLVDKGLATRVNERGNQSWDEREFRLTAEGVEVADRIVADPALEP